MDDLRWLYTSLEGRLRRTRFWLGSLGLFVVAILLGVVLSPLGLLGLIVANLIVFALYVPLVVKRLHDRGKPALPWAALFLGTPVLVNLAQTLGIGFDRLPLARDAGADGAAAGGDAVLVEPSLALQPNALGFAIVFVGAVVGIWALVELGFLRGTHGPNAFGPDPRADGRSG